MNTKPSFTRKIKNLFLSTKQKNKNSTSNSGPAEFETAISATKFGKFNFLLILIAIPAGWASIFETNSMSYVIATAQCDLDLTLNDKGLLNAITYLGMISSAVLWGFLVDTLGRKKLLTVGFLMDSIFVIASGFAQSKFMLMGTKFMAGFIINGPFAALSSYISEFHSSQYRARMQLALGTIFSFGTVVLPLLAWAILPKQINIFLLDEALKLHSWNFYILLCSLPSLISALTFFFMPESPKFLMTTGRNDKALKLLQKVYTINTGNSKQTYPIMELVNEIELRKEKFNLTDSQVNTGKSKIQALKQGLHQVKPLFSVPYLKYLILTCALQTFFTMSLNTLRLWLPQLFQAINDYRFDHNNTSADLCTMLDVLQPKNQSETCSVNLDNSFVYINSLIVAFVSIAAYTIAGFLINLTGKKKLLFACSVISGISGCLLYLATNTLFVVSVSALCLSFTSVATNIVLATCIDLFPTTLRTMTVSLSLMMARAGAMIGNLLFPILLQLGCAPPFFTIGVAILSCGVLSLLLPNTERKALE